MAATLIFLGLALGCSKKSPMAPETDPSQDSNPPTSTPTVVLPTATPTSEPSTETPTPVPPTETPTPEPPTATPTPQPKRVFVTSLSYSPDFGGLGAGDGVCQTRADAAGLGGTWMAWLSDSSTDARDRLVDVGPWYLTNQSTLVANNITDLTDGSIENPINLNEFGAGQAPGKIWTGTGTDGRSTGQDCVDWTSSDNAQNGTHGGKGETQEWSDAGTKKCSANQPHGLYCFEQ